MATNYAVAPGEYLQEWLDENDFELTQADLAARLGMSRKNVNEILKGKAPITAETALKLEKVTDIPTNAWLVYEAQYRADSARLSELAKLGEEHAEIVSPSLGSFLRKHGATKANVSKKGQMVADLLSFLNVGTFEAYEHACSLTLGAAVSTLRESNAAIDNALMMAWIAAGERTELYEESPSLSFDREKLVEILPTIKRRAQKPDDSLIEDISALLKSAGVIYQFVEPPTKFPLHGITRWTKNGIPVIQQTGRRKTDSYIVWTLFHEIGHILYDRSRNAQLDYVKPQSQKNAEEKQANAFAKKQLFDDTLYLYKGMTRASDIRAKARTLDHVPSVVVLHMHRCRYIDRSWCTELQTKVHIPFTA